MDNPSNNDLEAVSRCDDGMPYFEQAVFLMENSLSAKLLEAVRTVSYWKMTCADQKKQLEEVNSLSREVEKLKQNNKSLVEKFQSFYRHHDWILSDNTVQLTEVIANIERHISEMQNKFDLEKQSALEDCKDTVEEQWKHKLDKLMQELRSTESKLDIVTFEHAKMCTQLSLRTAQLKQENITQLQEDIVKTRDILREEKREWECSMRNKMEKEQDEFKKSFREAVELELKESKRDMEMKMSQAKHACRRVQRLVMETMVEEVDAKMQQQEAPGKDGQQRKEERNMYKSKPNSRNDEYIRKLNTTINEMQRVLNIPGSCIIRPLEKHKDGLRKDNCMGTESFGSTV